MRRQAIRQRTGDRVLTTVSYLMITFWLVLLLAPFLWLISSSMKDNFSIYDIPPVRWIPPLMQHVDLQLDYTNLKLTPDQLRETVRTDAVLTTWAVMSEFRATPLGEIHTQAIANGKLLFETQLGLGDYNYWRAFELVAQRPPVQQFIKRRNRLLVRQHPSEYFQTPHDVVLLKQPTTLLAKSIWDWVPTWGVTGKLVGMDQYGTIWRMLDNYISVWKGMSIRYGFDRYFANSLFVVSWSIFAQLTISSLAGYALSRLFKGRWTMFLTMFFLGTIMIPEIATLIPLYLTMNDLGVNGTLWAVFLPHTAWGMAVYLFKGFFDQLPQELFDAARIDGAKEIYVFSRMAAPLSKPVFGLITLLTFWAVWQEFLWPMVVLRDQALWTFPISLYVSQASVGVPYNQLMAASVIGCLPTVLIFMVFQNAIARGAVLGAVKG